MTEPWPERAPLSPPQSPRHRDRDRTRARPPLAAPRARRARVAVLRRARPPSAADRAAPRARLLHRVDLPVPERQPVRARVPARGVVVPAQALGAARSERVLPDRGRRQGVALP